MIRAPKDAVHVLTKKDKTLIDSIVKRYVDNENYVRSFHGSILTYIRESRKLQEVVHSIRDRLKDADHLREKLGRKLIDCKRKGIEFDITPDNLFVKITDLSGIRLIHLHTSQISDIDPELKEIFELRQVNIIEGPTARTWDDEYRETFKELGIETTPSESMYTSVHYVIGSDSKFPLTAEIQVRTLMEEVWGEVDHMLNYPTPVPFLACREQILALARVTSGATRLVDAIFASYDDLSRK
jgi:ppGpp synthetase/RelA/SpoT-type nucleotidyltranferase